MMTSTEQKSLALSILAYRQLLCVYPRSFRGQFGDQLLQAFGDLGRRAVTQGGHLQLMFFWMQMLSDMASSAAREHLIAALSSPFLMPRFRLRWIFGCGFGFVIGSLIAVQVRWWGATHNRWTFLLLGAALGWVQWVWALRRRPSEALLWTAASAVGMVIFSQTFLFVIGDTSPRLNFTGLGESIFALSVGAGVGLLQLLVLRKHGGTSWSWIPANVFGFFAGRWATLALNELLTRSSYIRPEFLIRHSSSHHSFISPELLIVVAPFVTGAIVGYFTSLSLESSFGRRESEAPMNGAQS